MPFELELFPFVVMSLEHKFIPCVAQQGEVAMVADLAGPGYKFELSSAVPAIGFCLLAIAVSLVICMYSSNFRLPKATLKFPAGEVSLEEKEEEEVKKMLSINGILQHQILNGVFSAQFRDDDLKLDTYIRMNKWHSSQAFPCLQMQYHLPFKRRFSPSDKLRWELLSSFILRLFCNGVGDLLLKGKFVWKRVIEGKYGKEEVGILARKMVQGVFVCMSSFPFLYALGSSKRGLSGEFLRLIGVEGQWNLCFLLTLKRLEVEYC
ncbi:Outer envelope pore protein 37, chloroplastic [Vitis vinifera]|uniref:Outer envelope pore protein 37, chloroplastic n=1 Tax=Vitis vinifera TaxID=29760 RepID=A0A438G9Z7_VITVI|nr:Outer envelope pore protein 37, chloroplastic [Vitis vinifera]